MQVNFIAAICTIAKGTPAPPPRPCHVLRCMHSPDQRALPSAALACTDLRHTADRRGAKAASHARGWLRSAGLATPLQDHHNAGAEDHQQPHQCQPAFGIGQHLKSGRHGDGAVDLGVSTLLQASTKSAPVTRWLSRLRWRPPRIATRQKGWTIRRHMAKGQPNTSSGRPDRLLSAKRCLRTPPENGDFHRYASRLTVS